jgi:hypothetical protein
MIIPPQIANYPNPPFAYTIQGTPGAPRFLVFDRTTGATDLFDKDQLHTFAGEKWVWNEKGNTLIPAPTVPVVSAPATPPPAVDTDRDAKIVDLLSQALKLLKGQP